jgi:hypothetical protein
VDALRNLAIPDSTAPDFIDDRSGTQTSDPDVWHLAPSAAKSVAGEGGSIEDKIGLLPLERRPNNTWQKSARSLEWLLGAELI